MNVLCGFIQSQGVIKGRVLEGVHKAARATVRERNTPTLSLAELARIAEVKGDEYRWSLAEQHKEREKEGRKMPEVFSLNALPEGGYACRGCGTGRPGSLGRGGSSGCSFPTREEGRVGTVHAGNVAKSVTGRPNARSWTSAFVPSWPKRGRPRSRRPLRTRKPRVEWHLLPSNPLSNRSQRLTRRTRKRRSQPLPQVMKRHPLPTRKRETNNRWLQEVLTCLSGWSGD